MMKKILITLAQSIVLTAAAVGIAVLINAARKGGIPLVADTPYEIFTTCKDADAVSNTATKNDISRAKGTLAVDARQRAQYKEEHVDGAVSVPYSALFGASAEDLETLRQEIQSRNATAVIVYGTFRDPDNPSRTIDFAKPLAEQLIESGLKNVRHVEGGLEAMKKQGARTVKGR